MLLYYEDSENKNVINLNNFDEIRLRQVHSAKFLVEAIRHNVGDKQEYGPAYNPSQGKTGPSGLLRIVLKDFTDEGLANEFYTRLIDSWSNGEKIMKINNDSTKEK